MSVGEFCNREVVITSRDTSVVDVAKLMRRRHVGDVIVVEQRAERVVPVGILTDRDIVVELIACEVDFDTVTAADIMSVELVTARERDGLWVTLKRMSAKGLRRMPVVNDKGGLEGIITVDDLLELLADEFASLARVGGREQELERQRRCA